MQIVFGENARESTVLFCVATYMWTMRTKLLTNGQTFVCINKQNKQKENLIF